jgi:hypothetical protein
MLTHDAAVDLVVQRLGLRLIDRRGKPHHAIDSLGNRFRISGRIDPADRHVNLGSSHPSSDYEWLVVVRFCGTVKQVANAWKIAATDAEAAADANGVLRLDDQFLATGVAKWLPLQGPA